MTARKGERAADELLRRLSADEIRSELRLDPAQIRVLRDIASGKPVRNAVAIMRAIELMLSYSQPKPKQEHEHSGAVTIEIRKLVGDPEDAA